MFPTLLFARLAARTTRAGQRVFWVGVTSRVGAIKSPFHGWDERADDPSAKQVPIGYKDPKGETLGSRKVKRGERIGTLAVGQLGVGQTGNGSTDVYGVSSGQAIPSDLDDRRRGS